MPNSDHTHSCRLMGGGNIAMVETETDLSHRDRSTSLTFIVYRKLPMSLRPSRSKVLLSTQSRNNISVAVLGFSYLCICICEYVFVNLYNVYVYLYFCLTPVCVYMLLTAWSRNDISVAVLGTRQPPLHHKDKCFVSTAAAKVARKIISEIQLRSYEI